MHGEQHSQNATSPYPPVHINQATAFF